MPCNFTGVSTTVPLTALLLRALLMAVMFPVLTPVTPAAAYCARLGLVALALLFCAAVTMASIATR